MLKRLRVSNETQPIPVIVVSGNESPTIEAAARERGAVDFLHESVDQIRLIGAVNRVLGIQANAS